MEPPILSFFLPLPLSPLLLAQMNFSFRKFSQAQALGKAGCSDPGLAGLPACTQPSLPRCADRAGGSGPRGGVITPARAGEGRVPRWLHRGKIICSVQSCWIQKANRSYQRYPKAKRSLKVTSHSSDVKGSHFRLIKAAGISRATPPTALLTPLHFLVCLNSCFGEWEERMGGN